MAPLNMLVTRDNWPMMVCDMFTGITVGAARPDDASVERDVLTALREEIARQLEARNA